MLYPLYFWGLEPQGGHQVPYWEWNVVGLRQGGGSGHRDHHRWGTVRLGPQKQHVLSPSFPSCYYLCHSFPCSKFVGSLVLELFLLEHGVLWSRVKRPWVINMGRLSNRPLSCGGNWNRYRGINSNDCQPGRCCVCFGRGTGNKW